MILFNININNILVYICLKIFMYIYILYYTLFGYVFICIFGCIKIRETTIHPYAEAHFVLYNHTIVYLLVIAFTEVNRLLYIIYIYIMLFLK